MAVEVRVTVEIGGTDPPDTYLRVRRDETVQMIGLSGDDAETAENVGLQAAAALTRVLAEVTDDAVEQAAQYARSLKAAA